MNKAHHEWAFSSVLRQVIPVFTGLPMQWA